MKLGILHIKHVQVGTISLNKIEEYSKDDNVQIVYWGVLMIYI